MMHDSAAIHTTNDEPDKDPPWTKEGDNTVEEMVWTVTLHVRSMMNLDKRKGGVERGERGEQERETE